MDGGFLDASHDDIIRLKKRTCYYGGRVLTVCGLLCLLKFNFLKGMERLLVWGWKKSGERDKYRPQVITLMWSCHAAWIGGGNDFCIGPATYKLSCMIYDLLLKHRTITKNYL